jgi:hypothetical protein
LRRAGVYQLDVLILPSRKATMGAVAAVIARRVHIERVVVDDRSAPA